MFNGDWLELRICPVSAVSRTGTHHAWLSCWDSIRRPLRVGAQRPPFDTHHTCVTTAALNTFRSRGSIPKSRWLREFCHTHIWLRGSRAATFTKEESQKVRTSETRRIIWPCRGRADLSFRQVPGVGCSVGEMRLPSRQFGNKVRNRPLSGSQFHRFDCQVRLLQGLFVYL